MAFIRQNMEEVEERKPFEPLPVGKYLTVIRSVEVKTKEVTNPGEKPSPYLEVVLEVAEDGPFQGRRLWLYTFTGKALGTTKRLYAITKAPFSPEGFETQDLIGRELLADVSLETYQGKLRNRVVAIFPVE